MSGDLPNLVPPEPQREPSKGGKGMLFLVVIGILLLGGYLSGVFDDDDGGSSSSGGSRVTAATASCGRAPGSLVADLNSGLTVDGGGSLSNVYTVRSGDFSSGYFVAGDIDGPGLEGDGDTAVWLVSGTPANPGLILSVDGMAKEFSVFPDAARSDAQATMADDGAREAERCARG